jgi:hypothetical protein
MKYDAWRGRWAFAAAALIALLAAVGCKDEAAGTTACNVEPDAGTCEESIPKYYYDTWTGECEAFTWSGCGGVVPFDTLADCEEACE